MKKLILTGAVLLNMLGTLSHADEIPRLMNLQSLIYDADGNLSTNETVDLTIRILDEDQRVIYTENQPGIPIVNGAVNVSVGSNQPLDPEVLDPSSGQKFLDIAVGAENPFETMPLVAVPYALWAEKALTVPDESIESRHIKNGTIEIEDLEPLAFSQLTGQASDIQIPSTIARGSDLASHISSTSAHPASAVVVSGRFVTVVAQNVQEFLEKIDQKLSEEIVNRRNSQEGFTTQTTNLTNLLNTERTERQSQDTTLQNTLNTHINGTNTNAHTFGNISGQIGDSQIPATITRDSEAASIADARIGNALASNAIPNTPSEIGAASASDLTSEAVARSAADTVLQTNIDSKVSKSGDVMTGPLNVPDPSPAAGLPSSYVVGRTLGDHEGRIGNIESGRRATGFIPADDSVSISKLRTTLLTSGTTACNALPTFTVIEESCTPSSGSIAVSALSPGFYFPVITMEDSSVTPTAGGAAIIQPEIRHMLLAIAGAGSQACNRVALYWNATCTSTPDNALIHYSIYKLLPN